MPSPPKIARSTGNGRTVGRPVVSYPEQNPQFTQGGAPAGKTFGSDLPVSSVRGKPATVRNR